MNPFRRSTLQSAVIFTGGFLGPFAAGTSTVIFPEIGESFGISAQAASLAVVVYMVPFATLMLSSGWIGARFGISRVLRTAFAGFTVMSLVAAISPSWELFLVSLALCGAANAFLTPLLLTTLRHTRQAEILGKQLGIYASMQVLGQMLAPLLGGFTALFEWRLAFVGVSMVAAILTIIGIPKSEPVQHPPGKRGVFTSGTNYALIFACFALGLGGLGSTFLVSLYAFDMTGASSVVRGVIITSAGIVAFICTNVIGRLIDRFGAPRILVICMVISMVGVASIPLGTDAVPIAVALCIATVGTQGSIVALNLLTFERPQAHLLIAITQSAKFYGGAVTPMIALPFYASSPMLAFGLIASITLLGLVVFLLGGMRARS